MRNRAGGKPKDHRTDGPTPCEKRKRKEITRNEMKYSNYTIERSEAYSKIELTHALNSSTETSVVATYYITAEHFMKHCKSMSSVVDTKGGHC